MSWCLQTKIIPDASGLHQLSLKILIFILLIFSLPLVHNRNFLFNFTKNLIPDQGPSVEYLARYFNFVFLRFKIYLFMVTPTFLKRTISKYGAAILISNKLLAVPMAWGVCKLTPLAFGTGQSLLRALPPNPCLFPPTILLY